MFRKLLPILAISLWSVSGFANDDLSDAEEIVMTKQCPPPCPEACPKPCPPPPCPKPCPAPCIPAPCPQICPAPCPKEPCCPPASCYWDFNPCNPKGCASLNSGFYIAADFLYWRAENNGFIYASELEQFENTADPAALFIEKKGKVFRVNPEWDFGFRAGLGWNSPNDFWDLFLNYTWYRNTASDSRTSVNGFRPFWPIFPTSQFRSVHGKTRLMMNMGDLEVGRLIYLTESVALRPHIGVRGGTLHQKFDGSFSSIITTNPDLLSEEASFTGKNNYWGVGPRTGFNGEWHINRGFSLVGNLAGALLYGKTQADTLGQLRHSNFFDPFVINTTEATDLRDDFYQLVPHLQLSFGFQWQTCFWCEKMFFKMGALWEANYWWNQFNFLTQDINLNLFPIGGHHPLTMEGLTVKFEWGF